MRLGLHPGALHAALPVEGEGTSPVSIRSAPSTKAPACAARRSGALRAGGSRPARSPARMSSRENRLDVRVREPLAASDRAAVEDRLARLERGGERHLDGDTVAVAMGHQAAEAGGEALGQHRLDAGRERRRRGRASPRPGRAPCPAGRSGTRRRCAPRAADRRPRARMLIASSKSRASSGSIVNVCRARRSTRSSSPPLGSLRKRIGLSGGFRVAPGDRSHAGVVEQSLEHDLDRRS